MEADELAVRRIRFRLYRFKSAVRPRQFRGECHLKTAEIDSRQPATHLLRFKMYPKLNANSRKKPHSPERTLSSPAELTPTMINRQGSVAVPGGPLGSATPSRRNSTVDSSGRFCALPTPNGQPEALISLCYLDQSEKIIVSVQKASNLDVEGSDTFVKVSVLSRYGEELAKHRSNSVKSASDTIFDCTAVFQIAKNELETSSVLIQIFRNAGMLRRRVQIGFVCVGENASSADAQTHWEQMIQGLGTSVEKWHNLQRPETTK
uniref:C2 domain-containing protein n=1 Tax=Panagrolaimus sp. JU765 TaxID=591449 RepID=A0AC34QZ40_9BILA